MNVLEFATLAGKTVRVAHAGPKSRAFCFWPGNRLFFEGVVGKKTPKSWAEWNVLPSWRLTAEGEVADRAWAEVSA